MGVPWPETRVSRVSHGRNECVPPKVSHAENSYVTDLYACTCRRIRKFVLRPSDLSLPPFGSLNLSLTEEASPREDVSKK